MNLTLNKVLRRLKFASVLLRKTATQKFKTSKNGFNYLGNNETRLKELLDRKDIDKSNAEAYYNSLKEALRSNFKNSGISYEDICNVIAGKLVYSKSGFTPDKVQQVLIDSYCKTNGLFQEVLFDFMFRDYNQKFIVEGNSVFDPVGTDGIQKIATEIKERGYAKLPFTLPKKIVDDLIAWSKDLEYTIIDDSLKGKYFKSKVDFNNMQYVKASAAEEDLKKNELVMKICKDPLLLSIIQSVLQSQVDILHLTMWWSFKVGKASAEAAQYFHYDLDSLRWLKVFVYLTDVDTKSGPHIAIPGSHALGGKNYKLLGKGYSRITDEEMANSQAGEVTEFYGPAGTIIIGDTRCWHKGKELQEGNRLILQPTYSASAFLKNVV
jgi:hypothetical protein